MIEFNQVMRVYSGKVYACCCGCSGKHTYRVATKDAGSKSRGYPVKDEECSDRSVNIILNKMNKNPETKFIGDYYMLETETRLYLAYLLPEFKA